MLPASSVACAPRPGTKEPERACRGKAAGRCWEPWWCGQQARGGSLRDRPGLGLKCTEVGGVGTSGAAFLSGVAGGLPGGRVGTLAEARVVPGLISRKARTHLRGGDGVRGCC